MPVLGNIKLDRGIELIRFSALNGCANIMDIENSDAFTREPGRVFWITGLSGAGKTTIGLKIYKHLLAESPNTVFLDGDILREVLGETLSFGMSEREKLGFVYARLCQMLSLQGLNVVCASISMFNSVRNWNREKLPQYTEIYLKTSIQVLIARDQKGLYGQALSGTVKNVIGMDIPFEEPIQPDIVIHNDGLLDPDKVAEKIILRLNNLR